MIVLNLSFVCCVTLITLNQFFTDGHVINRDGVFSQPHDLWSLDVKTPIQPFRTIFLFERFQHKVKECFVYVIANYGWKLSRISHNTVLIAGYN